MIIYLLGSLDVLTALWIALVHFEIVPWRPTVALAAYLLLKGFTFKNDIASKIDIATGFYMVIMALTSFDSALLSSFFIIWLMQKGLASLIL